MYYLFCGDYSHLSTVQLYPGVGATMPHCSVEKMCFTADLVITGTHLGKGRVSVDHIFYSSDPTTKTIKTLDIPSISTHSKILDEIFHRPEDATPISTNRLVLFLVKDKKGKFVPIYIYTRGSQGLFWYDEKACYG